jgi:hypothetical protein
MWECLGLFLLPSCRNAVYDGAEVFQESTRQQKNQHSLDSEDYFTIDLSLEVPRFFACHGFLYLCLIDPSQLHNAQEEGENR